MSALKIKLGIAIGLIAVSHFSIASPDEINSNMPELSKSELNSGGSAAYIQTGTDKKTAYFRFGDRFSGSSSYKWDVSIETPYDEDEDPAILGDFDGLATSSTVAYNLSRIKVVDRTTHISYDDGLHALCKKYAGIENRQGCSTEDIGKYFSQNKDPEKECSTRSKPQCKILIDERVRAFRLKKTNLVSSVVSQGLMEPVKAHILNGKVKIGFDQYKFRNTETIEEEKVNETPWSLSASYNFVKGNTAYGIGIELQEGFKESKTTQLCEPFETFENTLSCSDVKIGAPMEQKREILFLQISHNASGRNFAIQPKFSYDFEEGEGGITIPVYLMRDKKGLFTGGLQIGWQSQDDDIVAGVFIGKSFELF